MISIVIPTLNEAKTIGQCLSRLREQVEPHEIVVADGGSSDDTMEIASSSPEVKVISCATPGRGRQMNSGASASRGEVLLFLHSDTLLPPGFHRTC